MAANPAHSPVAPNRKITASRTPGLPNSRPLIASSPMRNALALVVLFLLLLAAPLGHATPATTPGPTPEGFSLRHMDLTVDPRHDFARFAAGTWNDTFEMPADKSRYGAFDALAERNLDNLRTLLEAAAAGHAPAGSLERQVGDFYAAALDEAAFEAVGLTPIESHLAELSAVDSPAALARLVGTWRGQGLPGLFGLWVGPDSRQSDIHALSFSQGGLSLPSRDYYFADQFAAIRTEFVAHLTRLFQLAGDDPATAAAEAALILDLETALAAHVRTPVQLRDRVANYHRYTLADFTALLAALPVADLVAASGLDLTALEYVIVGQPEFFTGLNLLLHERPLAHWRSHLRHRLLSSSATRLTAAFAAEHFSFYGTTLNGIPEQEPRWKRAVRATDDSLGEALSQLYVARYYPPEASARMATMIDNIKAVMRDRLANLAWMSPTTRAEALAKFNRFTARIGHPDTWRDISAIAVSRADYFGNRRAADHHESRRRLDRLGEEVDKTEWAMTAPTVNAYFQPTANQIVFPAGILQPPFFDFHADDAVNYGVIGAIIGHEIIHGFDDQGRRYDAAGNLRDWWTETDAAEFAARAQVLINQFNTYEGLPGFFVNGTLTQGENIADLGGVSIAFEALQRALAASPRPPLIDGYTPEQRFFIAWAQGWRTTYRDDALRRQLIVGPHAPGQFRAIGALVNQAAFHEAFAIQPGNPMWLAPADRAQIW